MPKPAMHVFVCTQNRPAGHPRGSCGERGCMEVFEAFINEVQSRMCFDKVAVTNSGCLGPCSTGPSVVVYPEGIMYGQLTKDDVATIFDEHLLGGKPVERLMVPADVWG